MTVEYRTLPRGGEKVSTIGLASGGQMFNLSYDEVVKAFTYAFDKGVNIVDFISHRDRVDEAAAEAIRPRRKDIYIQTHFGIDYPNNQYTKIRDCDYIKKFIERELKILDTDYIDFGLISNVDTMEDLDLFMKKDGIWEYMLKLKEEGIIRHLSFSSHDVDMCNYLLDKGCFDLFMISENLAEDFDIKDGNLNLNKARHELFTRCQKEGVSITTMKTFLGGKLLNESTSPLGIKFSPYQCIKYNLDRPAIVSCLTGISSFDNLVEILNYYEASDEEKDYSILGDIKVDSIKSSCIYCEHCQPCTAEIDIALVNKFKDLAEIGDTDALDHYKTLKYHASDCVDCGLCDERCPFHVNPSKKMLEAKEYFGY